MGKPKKYIGETWSNPFDHGGKDYRWDHKKKEYVVSHGESPISSITRALKEKFPDPLKHLDDARDERDNKWAEGAKGLAGALIGEDEPQSDLGSLADIIENIAVIKRTFDNNKKLGEETKDVKIENVAKDFSAYYDLDPFVDFANRTDDASQNFTKKLQELDPKDPKHNLVAKMVATNKLNSRGSKEENTNYIAMIQKSQTQEDTLPDIEDDINPQDPDWKTPNQAWLDDTANSPAAKAGLSDALRLRAKENYDQFKADRQKPEELTEKITDTAEKGAELTDSVKNIDGAVGDFGQMIDPDKLKFKSLFGNMA